MVTPSITRSFSILFGSTTFSTGAFSKLQRHAEVFQYPLRIDHLFNPLTDTYCRVSGVFQYPLRIDHLFNAVSLFHRHEIAFFQYFLRIDHLFNAKPTAWLCSPLSLSVSSSDRPPFQRYCEIGRAH